MRVTLVGVGCGGEGLSLQALRVLEQADCIVGPGRLLEELPPSCTASREPAVRGEDMLRVLRESGCRHGCVLYSGDTGFYSGARTLLPQLTGQGVRVDILPGLSSVQYFAAKLGHPWQAWTLHSAHGGGFDPISAACGSHPAFFLTAGAEGPGRICQQLEEAGLGSLRVIVGENLGMQGENVYMGTAAECVQRRFSPLNVMLAESAPRARRRTPGIPEEEFVWGGGVPVVRQEVRAAALARLGVEPEELCWDIGAGAGSFAVELALQCREVWAAESRSEALSLARINREKFGAWNLRLEEGVDRFPKPDAVLLEEEGELDRLLEPVRRANPQARVCVVTASLDTLYAALDHLERAEAAQLSVSRVKEGGGTRRLACLDPVFLISGQAGER